MKKNLFLLGLAVAAMTSCSESDVVDVASTDSKAIKFENFVNKSTRTITDGKATDNDLLAFSVWGGSGESKNLFSGEEVSRTTTADSWGYAAIKYWMAGRTYKFAAYAPINDNVTPSWSYDNNKIAFTATVDNENQYDLVYDVANSVTTSDPLETQPAIVAFSLKHILSKVQLAFKKGTSLEAGTQLVITNISLGAVMGNGIMSKGTYDGTEDNVSWSIVDGAENVVLSATPEYTVTDDSEGGVEGQAFYVIPQVVGTNLTANFTVKLQQYSEATQEWVTVGNPMNLSAQIDAPTWNPGYVYTYTATIEAKNIEGAFPIDFSATVEDWNGENNVEILNTNN